jgi:hypothetical protein
MGVHLMAIDDCTIASVGPRRSLLGPRPLLAAGNEVAARPDRDSAVLNVGSLL